MKWSHVTQAMAGETPTFSFRVKVSRGKEIVNAEYGVISAEGTSAVGLPLTTTIHGGQLYLPVIRR